MTGLCVFCMNYLLCTMLTWLCGCVNFLVSTWTVCTSVYLYQSSVSLLSSVCICVCLLSFFLTQLFEWSRDQSVESQTNTAAKFQQLMNKHEAGTFMQRTHTHISLRAADSTQTSLLLLLQHAHRLLNLNIATERWTQTSTAQGRHTNINSIRTIKFVHNISQCQIQ